MEKNNLIITVETSVNIDVEKVWEFWVNPKYISKWYRASEDWHVPFVENDLNVGGKFVIRMEAKDGSFGFDLSGVYEKVELYKFISYELQDRRKVEISFIPTEMGTKVIERFEAEKENPIELQKNGWQAILDNFKKSIENEEI